MSGNNYSKWNGGGAEYNSRHILFCLFLAPAWAVSVTLGDAVRNLNKWPTHGGVACESAVFLMPSGHKQVHDGNVFHLVCKIKCSKYTAGSLLHDHGPPLKQQPLKRHIQHPTVEEAVYVCNVLGLNEAAEVVFRGCDLYRHLLFFLRPLPCISEVWHQPLPDSWGC